MSRSLSRHESRDSDQRTSNSDLSAPSIGFIMCECGLEDLSVTAVRRLGYRSEGESNDEKLNRIDKTVNEMEEEARRMSNGGKVAFFSYLQT